MQNEIHNPWLGERSRIFEKYSKAKLVSTDRVEVCLGKCEHGWIDIHFIVNSIEKGIVELSSTYEPFMDIIKWLENIVRNEKEFSHGVSMVEINCEAYGVALYYEPMLTMGSSWNGMEPWSCENTGLFYVFDGATNTIFADAFCDTRELVKSIYGSIISYAEEFSGNEDFIEEWCWDAYNEIIAENESKPEDVFLDIVKSLVVEDYIVNGAGPRFVKIK